MGVMYHHFLQYQTIYKLGVCFCHWQILFLLHIRVNINYTFSI